MRDLIPEEVLSIIRDRYLAGVADAEAKHHLNAADEDSLTGALGAQISSGPQWSITHGDKTYHWKVESYKVRGRGPGALEKIHGTDGIFQIEVFDERGVSIRKKGLPFQSKANWKGVDPKVVQQSKDMLETLGDGLVIDFESQSYTACHAEDVIEAGGRIEALRADGKMQSLGQILGNEFLNCEIGKINLVYDPVGKRFTTRFGEAEPKEVIQTTIVVTPRDR